jgi:hypothetical protein
MKALLYGRTLTLAPVGHAVALQPGHEPVAHRPTRPCFSSSHFPK